MRSRLVVVALVVLWILCVGGEPAARVIGDDLRCAPIHPHLINVSSDDLSIEPGKRSSELTTRPQAHDLDQSRSPRVCVYRERVPGGGQFV